MEEIEVIDKDETEMPSSDGPKVAKQDKIVYDIYMRMKVMSLNKIDMSNYYTILVNIMSELNLHNLHGFKKKELASQIFVLLLNDFADKILSDQLNLDIISDMIEQIYYHKYHKNGSCCVIL